MSAAAEALAGASFWRSPLCWLKENNLSKSFWIYFTASLFFDAGFCVYFFVFNLYLLDLQFREGFVGLISGSMTLGTILVMLPAGLLCRRIGVKRLLIMSYVLAPAIHALRVVWVWAPAQVGLSILGGMALSMSGVCYLPIVARLTNEKNRTAAFSLIFSAALVSGAVGAAICSYIPGWLQHAGMNMSAMQMVRLILIISCVVGLLAVIPAMYLHTQELTNEQSEAAVPRSWPRPFSLSMPAVRVLLPISLWAIVLAAFYPFGNVYLASQLKLPLGRISFVFSMVQVVQLIMLGATPVVLRLIGKANGLLAIQTIAGITLGILACTQKRDSAIALFLLFTALQWMANPGLYDLMMSRTPDAEREAASALMLFCNAIVSVIATPCAGLLYTRYGYHGPLIGIGALAIIIAGLSRSLLAPHRRDPTPDSSERSAVGDAYADHIR